MILFNMIRTGVFERFPDLKFIGTESYAGWVPYYLERFDESVRRNRKDWNLPLLPSEYFHRNALVVYIIDELGLARALRRRDRQHHVGSRLPALHEQLAGRLRARPRVPPSGPARRRARSSGSCGGTPPTCTSCRTRSPTPSRSRRSPPFAGCRRSQSSPTSARALSRMMNRWSSGGTPSRCSTSWVGNARPSECGKSEPPTMTSLPTCSIKGTRSSSQ